MGRFTEKQLLLATVLVSCLMVGAFGVLIYLDLDAIYASEVTDASPEAAEITDEEAWGEKRKIYELELKMKSASAQAELIPKRETDVIVYREIVKRDAQILPNFDDVNRLVDTIGEFERLSGVVLTEVSKLQPSKDAKGKAIRTMPISLKFSGTFEQTLKFINLFESLDRIVNTQSFVMAGGRGGDEPDEEVIHDCKLELLTFIYTSTAGLGKQVTIDNYGKRKDDPIIQKMIRQQKPANVDKYQLMHRVNRRDPLIDPRALAMDDGENPDDVDYGDQKDRLDELRFEMQLLKEDVRQEDIYRQEKKYVQLYQIQALIDQKVGELAAKIEGAAQVIRIAELVEGFRSEVVAPFEKVKSERDYVQVPVMVSKREVEDFHGQIEEAYESKDYERVLGVWETFKTRIKNTEVDESAAQLVDGMEATARDSQVLLEFSRLTMKVSGVIIIKNRPEKSSVIINGTPRRVGSYVDEGQHCRLDAIQKGVLVFNFKGERIESEITK